MNRQVHRERPSFIFFHLVAFLYEFLNSKIRYIEECMYYYYFLLIATIIYFITLFLKLIHLKRILQTHILYVYMII